MNKFDFVRLKTFGETLKFLIKNKNKTKIITEIKKNHSDDCPIIAFFDMDGNDEFLKWIKESVA
jgi:uncharacterized protein involved in tolerance to divalent cations